MLINLFQITFFNQYILSPKTWIHKIPSNFKISLKFVYLLIVPYIHWKYILFSIIIYIIVLIHLPIPKYYILSKKQIIFIVLVYMINSYIYTTNSIIDVMSITEIELNKEYIYNIFFPNDYLRNQCNKALRIIHTIPQYILRSIIIYKAYCILLKIIYLTTQYENIIQCYLKRYKQNAKRLYINKLFIFISSSFMIFLINEIDTVIHAAIIRNSSDQYLYYYAIKHFFYNIVSNTTRISYVIYHRENLYNNIS